MLLFQSIVCWPGSQFELISANAGSLAFLSASVAHQLFIYPFILCPICHHLMAFLFSLVSFIPAVIQIDLHLSSVPLLLKSVSIFFPLMFTPLHISVRLSLFILTPLKSCFFLVFLSTHKATNMIYVSYKRQIQQRDEGVLSHPSLFLRSHICCSQL